MERGNSLSRPGLGCVHLSLDNTSVSETIEFAAEIGAIDWDGEEALIIVRFPGESSDEAVTEEELEARLSVPLVNG